MSAPQINRQVRRRLDRFIDKKRRQGMPEKTVVQIMLDALIELMNERDGDPDAEDEPEFAGVDLAVLATRGHRRRRRRRGHA